jgi:NAD(P)-dependent dehydrogenase (short-subunit alcohol dehydrogenase family)
MGNVGSKELTMRGLADKRVLITGGASGIGAATVKRFLEEGSRVAVLDNDREGCRRIGEEAPGLSGTTMCDVSDPEAVKQAFTELDELFGGLDVLINNAGISIRHPDITELPVEQWQRVINVDLNGVFYVAQQAAQRMKDSGGVIINMGSTAAVVGHPHYADYNAAKAGVHELTKTMALELAPKVRVVAVCPGYVLTPMQKAEYTPKMIDEVNSKIPLKRHARPEEIAGLFAFLASEDASYIAGHAYIVDGGEIVGGLASR